MSIDAPSHKKLIAPFTATAVGWRADAKYPDGLKRVRSLCYLDASLARERLNEVDLDWTATYTRLSAQGDGIGAAQFVPVECALTVCGVTRYAVGQANNSKPTANHVKAAYSDALKRAALEFGVGAYLRALKSFHVQEGGYWTHKQGDKKGQVGGIDPSGIKQLRADYATLIATDMFVTRFGEATDYGDFEDDERSATPEGVGGDAQQTLGVAAPVGRAVKRGVRS